MSSKQSGLRRTIAYFRSLRDQTADLHFRRHPTSGRPIVFAASEALA